MLLVAVRATNLEMICSFIMGHKFGNDMSFLFTFQTHVLNLNDAKFVLIGHETKREVHTRLWRPVHYSPRSKRN